MDQPIPTIAVEPQKTRWVLFSFIGSAILMVGITAGFLIGKYVYTPKPLPTPLPAGASAKEGDPTANWKTYINTIYGINIKYPDEFTYTSTGPNLFQQQINQGKQISGTVAPSYDTVNFTNGNNSFSLGIFHTQTILGDGAFDGSCGTQFAEKTLINTQDKINNFPYRKILESDKGNQNLYYCFLSGNNNLAVLSVINNSPDNIEYYNQLFDQILSTFKFADQATPGPTCKPRPACLDATPRCMIPETSDMCPPNQKL